MRADLGFSLMLVTVDGTLSESAARFQHTEGNTHHFYEPRRAFGHDMRLARIGIIRLRKHKHARAKLLQAIFYIADEGEIGGEFTGGEAADTTHWPLSTDKGIEGGNDIYLASCKCVHSYFIVKKAGVIHKYEDGLVL